ncbi:hypothetical protein [Nitratireductor aquibiodomus]|uniref:hypothetical protein n=1 Tax=Nitratireductor aquibiodomus TaxID=204799 RepID=UPI00046ACD35|nr:hypothetical protein [Nitratireductor aquibiodomus]
MLRRVSAEPHLFEHILIDAPLAANPNVGRLEVAATAGNDFNAHNSSLPHQRNTSISATRDEAQNLRYRISEYCNQNGAPQPKSAKEGPARHLWLAFLARRRVEHALILSLAFGYGFVGALIFAAT